MVSWQNRISTGGKKGTPVNGGITTKKKNTLDRKELVKKNVSYRRALRYCEDEVVNSGNDMLWGVQAMYRVAKRQFKMERGEGERKESRTVSLNSGQPAGCVYQTDYQRTGVGAAAKETSPQLGLGCSMSSIVTQENLVLPWTRGSQHHESVGRGKLTGAQAQTGAVQGSAPGVA